MFRTSRGLLVLALLLGSARAAPPSGLLLGRLIANEHRYQTLWIYDDGQQIEIVVVPDILLPRQNGFWRIGAYRTLEAASIEESDIWAVPSRQRPSVALALNQQLITQPASSPCDYTYRNITFINPNHVWYRANSGVECGAHPDGSTELYAARLESRRTRLDISEMVGESGLEAYHQAVIAAFAEAKKSAGFECEPAEDPRNWSIKRGQGKWKVTGWAETHRLCGYGLDLEIPIELPPSIAGYDRLPKPWAELSAEIPGLLDAFCSPTNRMLVAITKEAVLVYRPSGPEIGPLIRRYPFAWHVGLFLADTAVMSQWAVGARSIARWTKEVESTREIRPLVHRK